MKNPAEHAGPQAAFASFFEAMKIDSRFEPLLRKAFMAGVCWSIGRQQLVGDKIAKTAMRFLPKDHTTDSASEK